MTRRDYITIAESFRRTLDNKALTTEQRAGVETAAKDMAWELSRQNSAFDQHMFLLNAGVVRAFA